MKNKDKDTLRLARYLTFYEPEVVSRIQALIPKRPPLPSINEIGRIHDEIIKSACGTKYVTIGFIACVLAIYDRDALLINAKIRANLLSIIQLHVGKVRQNIHIDVRQALFYYKSVSWFKKEIDAIVTEILLQ